MRRSQAVARGLAVLAALAVLTHAAPSAAAGPTNKRPSASDPGELYHAYCSVCHGERGDGQSRARNSLNPPPLDFTDPAAAPRLTRERMIDAVRDGRPGTAMVGWRTQLDDTRIAAIVDHVRERFVAGGTARAGGPGATADPGRTGAASAAPRVANTAPATSAAASAAQAAAAPAAPAAPGTSAAAPAGPAVDMSAAMPGGLPGRVDAGRRLYDANCFTCHGTAGDGKGPRAYFIRPAPRDFTSADSRRVLNRPLIFHAVSGGKTGTEMPAWRPVLTQQEIADVSEYVFARFVSPSGELVRRGR